MDKDIGCQSQRPLNYLMMADFGSCSCLVFLIYMGVEMWEMA